MQFAKIEQNLRYFDFVNCQLSHAQSDRITQKVQFQFKLIEMLGEKNISINLSEFGNLRK